MKHDLISRIEKAMPELSKSQRAIGNYIIANYDKSAYLTASKLGAAVGVSESTVVRFAIELGYDGYPRASARTSRADPYTPDECSANGDNQQAYRRKFGALDRPAQRYGQDKGDARNGRSRCL